MSDRLLSAAEAEMLLGVPAVRVREWKRSRRLFASGLDSSRRPLYRESAIRELIGVSRRPRSRV